MIRNRMLALFFVLSAKIATAALITSSDSIPPTGVSADDIIPRNGLVYALPITGANSYNLQGDPQNDVLSVALTGGTPATLTGFGWNTNLETFGGSWFGDAVIRLRAAGTSSPFIDVVVAPGNSGTGGPTNFSSGGVIKFATIPIANLALPTGQVEIEFYEQFDDVLNGIDATYHSTLSLMFVPEPATLLMIAVAIPSILRRRMRRTPGHAG